MKEGSLNTMEVFRNPCCRTNAAPWNETDKSGMCDS